MKERFTFFASFLLMILPNKSDPYIKSDIFCLLNMGLFAFLNGFSTSTNMELAPSIVSEDEKETVGFIMSFPLTFGILSGSFLALTLKNIGWYLLNINNI